MGKKTARARALASGGSTNGEEGHGARVRRAAAVMGACVTGGGGAYEEEGARVRRTAARMRKKAVVRSPPPPPAGAAARRTPPSLPFAESRHAGDVLAAPCHGLSRQEEGERG